jgi:four helix bundle protein
MDLVVTIYELTKQFPSSEMYGLTNQMRRGAISIPSNIAEGSRRRSKKDIRHFLIIAYGSGSELETQIEIARRLNYISHSQSQRADDLLNQVMKILNKLISQLENPN